MKYRLAVAYHLILNPYFMPIDTHYALIACNSFMSIILYTGTAIAQLLHDLPAASGNTLPEHLPRQRSYLVLQDRCKSGYKRGSGLRFRQRTPRRRLCPHWSVGPYRYFLQNFFSTSSRSMQNAHAENKGLLDADLRSSCSSAPTGAPSYSTHLHSGAISLPSQASAG